MEFRKAEPSHAKEAAELAVREYTQEASKNHYLNPTPDIQMLEAQIGQLFTKTWNLAAFEQETMIGYLAFFNPMAEQFGRVKGAFSPLHGSAFTGDHRSRLASLLFQKLADPMAQSGIGSFAVCKYAHDSETISSFVLNGFGIRCSDSIRDLKDPLNIPPMPDFQFCELYGEQKKCINSLDEKLSLHLAKCPTFLYQMPKDPGGIDPSIRVFAAFHQGIPAAFMNITHGGETFVSEAADTLHICGAYCLPEYRNSGLSAALFAHIADRLAKEQVSYLGVDCETINPNALHFWGKYFENYTYSFVRRLDERLLPKSSEFRRNEKSRPKMDDRITGINRSV